MISPPGYLAGVVAWLALWAAAFSVSALFARLRLHGGTKGDVLLIGRDLTATALALWAWSSIGAAGSIVAPGFLDAALALAALGGTVLYLRLVAARGIRRVATANMYEQRHPIIPLRILSFAIFQQSAATLLLLDWNRRFADEGTALVRTALIFGLTHLGVASFGLPLARAGLLTIASGAAMLGWGALRIYGHAFWSPLAIHYLFYIALACRAARA